MQKVIIADDDFLVRTYLKQLIDWQAAGLTIAGEAKNGREALKLARELAPALIITDICMPVMDGIELIKALRAENSSAHILVLSCHDDFHYVREALKLGVDDYLLKDNLTPDNIRSYLAEHLPEAGSLAAPAGRASSERAGGDGASAVDSSDMTELARLGREKLRADFLAAFTAGTLAGDLRAAAERAGLAPSRLAIGLTLDLRGWRERRAALSPAELAALFDSIGELVTAASARLESCAAELFTLDRECGRLGIILLLGNASASIAAKTASELAAHVLGSLRRYLNLGGVLVMTAPQSLEQLMPQWSKLARSEGSFFLADGCYQSRDLPELTELAELTELNELTGLTEQTERVSLADLAALIGEHRLTARARLELSRRAGAPPELAARLAAAESCAELAAILADYLAASSAREDYHPSIVRALELIEAHYTEPITQPDIAAAVHLNAAYFSTLFKKNVGQGFREYLAERRITAVKQELTKSTARIKDIAAAAGFEDYPYFCRLFRSLTGLSPQEYRLQALK